ncbi:MAG: glutathione S-transferase [Novosphingobium sp.]|nr:glutathione S-transferase [Novosphingobium sp.]
MSPYVVKVLAAADYKRLAYTHQEHVSIRELSKLNPDAGKVPVVRFDGQAVFDSTLILRRFDRVQSTPSLLSEDPTIAAQQRLLEDWSDEAFYWYNQALRWSVKNERRTIKQNSRFVPVPLRFLARPLLRRLVGKQPNAQGLGRLPYDMLVTELAERLDDLTTLQGPRNTSTLVNQVSRISQSTAYSKRAATGLPPISLNKYLGAPRWSIGTSAYRT